METIDYEKMLAEAKRLKRLNEIVLKEITDKQNQMEKSVKEINSRPKPSENEKTKTCPNCGK